MTVRDSSERVDQGRLKMSVYEQLLAKVLSVYYNVKYGGYLLGNVLGYGPNILAVKERKVKPPVLSEGITDHTVKINVSIRCP